MVHCDSPICCDLLHVTDSLGKIAMVWYGILIGSCCVDGDASRDGCRCCRGLLQGSAAVPCILCILCACSIMPPRTPVICGKLVL